MLIVTPESSVLLREGKRITGPGTADRAGFSIFVTKRGIRLVNEKCWR